jgi:hypothetical protein
MMGAGFGDAVAARAAGCLLVILALVFLAGTQCPRACSYVRERVRVEIRPATEGRCP